MIQIAIDLDGVCYNFIHTLREYLILKTGKPRSAFPPEVTWWFFLNEWEMTMDEYIHWTTIGINENEIFWRGPEIPDALWGVQELYRAGYYIKFITARGSRKPDIAKKCEQATLFWLNSHGFPYDEVIVSSDKTNYEFDLLIDDSPTNQAECVASNRNVLIFEQPYNQDVVGPRAKNWFEVVQYVKEKFPIEQSIREVV